MRAGSGVLVAILLAVVLAALLPLAYASPPDPTWLGGVWDDADYDDVVVAAIQAVASVDSLTVFEPKPRLLPGFVSLPPRLNVGLVSADTPYQLRAPPA